MICDGDYKIHFVALPTTVHGLVTQDKNGFFDIYINQNIGIIEQKKAIMHEFEHIERGDFLRIDEPLEKIENIHIEMGDYL